MRIGQKRGRALFEGSIWCLGFVFFLLPLRSQDDPDLSIAPIADYATPSPDGTKLLFVSNATGNQTIWTANRDGTAPQPLIDLPGSDQLDPDWSPDGQHIVFASNRNGTQFDIWTMAANGTGAIPLTTSSGDNLHPRYSPNGQQIVFTSNRTGKRELWQMSADGTNQQEIAPQSLRVSDPSWSPDGTAIVYVGCMRPSGPTTGDASCNLYTIALGAIQGMPVTSGTALDWSPDWGSGGIVFESDRGGAQGLWLVNPDGSNLRQLTDPGPTGDEHPRWDRISNSIVFTRAATAGDTAAANIWSSDLSGASQQLTFIQSFLGAGDTTPPVTTASISPNPNANGWNNTNLTVTLNSSDSEAGGVGVKQITFSAAGAQAIAGTIANNASTSLVVNSEGTTTITFFGTDNAGNVEAPNSLTIKLDKTPPVSQVLALPALENAPSFKIQWSGSDAGSGIQDFTIFVSDNGGAFAAFLTNTSTASATFNGQMGHTYGFYSIARDLAGNVEAAKSHSDSSTSIPSCAIDMTSSVRMTPSGFGYNIFLKRYGQTLTLTNTGTSPINGPIYVVLDNLSANASLYNSTGKTSCATPLGSPFISITGPLNAGTSATVPLQFTDPTNAAISYNIRLLAGPGQP
jgi:TolB protein